MLFQRTILVVICILMLCSCAQINSIYRPFDVNEGKGALIDIKQRAVIVKERDGEYIVCAEPSPEALSSYAAQLAAEADLPEQVTASLVSAFQEGSAFVGLRTPSIQLLRDSTYRLCESYMNGALDKAEYEILMRRYQKDMVALLAIEQLTGTVRAPAVAVSTQGNAAVAQSISTMRKEIEKINSEIAELEKSKKTDNDESEEQKMIVEDINNLKEDKKVIEEGIKNARRNVASGSSNVIITTVGTPSQRSDVAIAAISKVVYDIVKGVIGADDSGQLCLVYLRKNDINPSLTKACREYWDNINLLNRLRLKQAEILLNNVMRKGRLTDTQVDSLMKLLDGLGR